MFKYYNHATLAIFSYSKALRMRFLYIKKTCLLFIMCFAIFSQGAICLLTSVIFFSPSANIYLVNILHSPHPHICSGFCALFKKSPPLIQDYVLKIMKILAISSLNWFNSENHSIIIFKYIIFFNYKYFCFSHHLSLFKKLY